MPARYQDHYFGSADGRLRLYARLYGSGGPPLVAMHGLTRNSADFEAIASHLAGRFRVVAPDQRGRGRSDHDPDPASYTPPTYCADTLRLIDSLGLERPVLLGTSMGGLMAMLMGALDPHRYRALILNDVGPEVDPAGLARIASYVGAPASVSNWSEAAEYCRRTNGHAFPGYAEEDWQAFARKLFAPAADGTPRLAYDPAIASGLAGPEPSAVPPDLWPVWDALRPLPILVIRGELSDILSRETLDSMASRHPGLSIADVPGVGHAPMLDEPAAIEAIDAFLDQLDRAGK